MRYELSENPITSGVLPFIGQPNDQDTLRRLRLWLHDHCADLGSRLPAERALAATLGVSRPELRKALSVLEIEGRIHRHVGRGTFVTAPPPLALSRPDLAALADRISPHDAMMSRLTLEPELARLAALHATPIQIDALAALARDIRDVTGWDEYERLDYAFHDTIAESAGRPLLYEMFRIMNAVRQVVVWRQLSPGADGPAADYHSFDEHDAIAHAIARRDRSGAHRAMTTHLETTLTQMTADPTAAQVTKDIP